MQHTPPRVNAKKIILKLDLFMQSLKKLGKEMPYNVNQGPKLCTYLSKFIHLQYQDTTFQYQLLYPVWRKSVKKMPKIESENQFVMSVKGRNSVLLAKIYPSAISGHSFPISTLIASLKKIGWKMLSAESENDVLTNG